MIPRCQYTPMLPRAPFIAFFVASIVASTSSGQSAADNLDSALEPIRRQYNLPGLLGLTVKRGRILGQGAAGRRHHGDTAALNIDDPINIGSCTKWMTATLAGRLVDRGVIDWTTQIRDVFPNWGSFHPAYWPVTLEELLAHRGGVPDGAVWEPRYRPRLFAMDGTVTQLRRWVADATLTDAPQAARGTELYSNQGYAIAAAMLELRTGKSWETLMAEEVFGPLEMASARIGSSYDSLRTPAPAAVGHDHTSPSAVPVPRAALAGMDLIRYQAMAGPGGMVVCTLKDWARFLHRHAVDGEGYLTAATARKLRTPFVGETGYALGVGVLNQPFAEPDKALNHTGDILGQTALFWVAPASDLILLVYTNTAARGSSSAEGRNAVAAMMLGRYRDSAPFGPYLDGRAQELPVIRSQPAAVLAQRGDSASFSVRAEGTGLLSYQWKFNDVALSGATAASLIVDLVGPQHVGFYSVDVRDAVGVVASAPALLEIVGERPANRLSNLSILASFTPDQTLTVGFTVTGGAAPVLVRAVGPGLRAVGIATPLPDPGIALYSGSQMVAENDDWIPGVAFATATAKVGAFPLEGGSRDSGLLRTVQGTNTVAIGSSRGSTSDGNGSVLVEVYDAALGATGRLTNLSFLGRVSPDDGTLIAGFTIAGAGHKRLLVRAVGPALSPWGVSDALADPRLELLDGSGVRVHDNDNWDAAIAPAFAAAGAFALPVGSRDAAMTVNLAVGSYTVQVTRATGSTGSVLIEVYELP